MGINKGFLPVYRGRQSFQVIQKMIFFKISMQARIIQSCYCLFVVKKPITRIIDILEYPALPLFESVLGE